MTAISEAAELTDDYLAVVQQFEEVTDTFLLEKHKHVYLFMGRATCPHCRAFSKDLAGIVNSGAKVYYLDTDKYKTSEKLKEFAQQNGIQGVPAFLKFDRSGHLNVYDFATPLDEWMQ